MVPARWRPAAVLGALGFVSGVVTPYVGIYIGELLPSLGLRAEVRVAVPFGLCFAVAVAMGVFLWTGERRAIPVVLITTMLAWIALILLGAIAEPWASSFRLMPVAGAVGAVLTHLGCSVVAPVLRHRMLIALTGLAGMVASVIVGPAALYMSPLNALKLFGLWQGAVAFCIGAGLATRTEAAAAPAASPASGPTEGMPRDVNAPAGSSRAEGPWHE
jgi:hypothetical protein